MSSRCLFLLIYLLGSCFGQSSAQRNESCTSGETCVQGHDSTSSFLHCVGLPSNDTGRHHLRRLKDVLEAAMDVYTFMRTSMTGVPFLSLQGALELNPSADPLQNEALVQMWLEVKIKPLLKSITKHFLTCLSTKNFSCSTYQTVVRELSHYYSEMEPVRQKWIYTFFMYPFLSGDRVAGCAGRNESSEEWLMKNFGAFRGMARMKDFSTLNMIFSGLEVLHLLSPAQKAELLLMPGVAGLDNGTLTLIFHSLLTGGPSPTHPSRPPPTMSPGLNWTSPGYNWTTPGNNWTNPGYNWTTPGNNWTNPGYNWTTPGNNWTNPGYNWTTPGNNWTNPGYNWTTPGYYPPSYPPQPTYNPMSPQHGIREVVNGFMMAFKPIGSFVHDFVSFTRERNVSEIRSTTLTQFLLNWTLAELADMYRPRNTSVAPEPPKFDVTNVEDWYKQVVMPVLRRFLPNTGAPMHQNIKLAFHQLFYLDHQKDNETSEILDVCSITLDKIPCGLTNAVEHMAQVLHCAARSNLAMTEETIMQLIIELTKRLNSLMKELSTTNFNQLGSDIKEIFSEAESPSLTLEHLQDPEFIKLWFKVKMLPLLPDVPPALLACLSTKNFSCPVFQTIVASLSKHMSVMDADPKNSHTIYHNFIYPLLNKRTSDPQCLTANNSIEWLKNTFGYFSRFAFITDFYKLNPNFDGLEVLHLLAPKQIAEMLVVPLGAPPEKDVVIDQVFDFLMETPEKFAEVLHHLPQLAMMVNTSCGVYKHIFVRLYEAIPSLPPDVEPDVWAGIDRLIKVAPDECLPVNITCPVTHFNASHVCKGVNSSDLELHLNTSTSMSVSCNFTLEKYACAKLENFTANQLVSLLKCDLPGNSSHSKILWKMLLTKLSNVLDQALDMLANASMTMVGPSAVEVLDVIGEIRVSLLTDEQLMNSSEIRKWFSRRLSGFLPSASVRFLRCLNNRNLSCQSYQQILQVFIHHFDHMALKQKHMVLKNFILPLLSQPQSGPGCVNGSGNSTEWLKKNLGPFSAFLSLTELLHLNPLFNPMEALRLLTPKQSAELLVSTHPSLPDKDIIINRLFDFLTEAPEQNKIPEFMFFLSMFLQKGNLSCSSYKTLFTRLDMALTEVSPDIASNITYSKIFLSKHLPPGCIIYGGNCSVTITNETEICVGVNSTELQLLLSSGQMEGRLCDFAVEEFACASLSALTAEHLAAMLMCNRSSNSSGSRPIWKLLLSKASRVLDEALDLLANKTLDPRNPALSVVLDSIREIRLDVLDIVSINHPDFIQLWFNRRLRPLLSAVSPDFLSCLVTKGLNCSTYQHILQVFIHHFDHMALKQKHMVLKNFILPLLSQPQSGPGCVNGSGNSTEWLKKNLGPFSAFLSLTELLHLNPLFNPMEALRLLTPKQSAELLVSTHPSLPDKDIIINRLFDFLTEAPEQNKIPEFMFFLGMFLQKGNLSCSSYKTLFTRLDMASIEVSPDIASNITYSKIFLSKHLPPGCIIYGGNCSVTITNETEICVGVNSTELQLLLSSGQMEGRLCDFAVEEFACASLSALTAEHLAAMLMCNRSSNSSGSRPIWKLLLSKASRVLDEALDLLTNKTLDPRNPALPVVLDSIREIRLDVLDTVSINHPDFIQLWFNRRLRPLLSAVSPDFLSCLVTKGLNCSTYQHILQVFIHHFDHMDLKQKHMVLKNFILPLLSQPQSGPGCVNGSGNSTEWLKKNLGPFSAFLSLTELLHLNPLFNPMEALRLLTPKQSAELLVSTHPSLPDKDIIINRLFDFLTEAPEQNKIPEFMFFLSMFLQKGNLSCSSYKTLFTRLDMASIEVSPDIASNITYSKIFLSKHLPPGCIIYGGNCSVTITNETEICVGVNSTELQLLLSSGQMEGRLCDFAVEEFACASLSALTAEHLAAMLMCNRSSNSSGSRPIWKLLLSKASRVLDEALDLLANKTLDPRNPALPVVLDSIREIRLDVLDTVSINHPDVIQLWFNRRLRPLLSAVSPDFLSCLVTKGLNCSTYQHILQVFIHHFDHMALKQKHMVLKNFILPLLSQPQSGPGCVNGSGNSTEWLKKNLGPFSAFLSLTELLHLNPLFNPMEALRLLTPKQSAELLVSTHPSLPDKDIIINRLFDFLTEAPEQNKIPEFMFFLGMFLQKGNLSCSSYKTLFTRLDMASIEVSPDIASNITYSKIFLSKHLPPGCIIYGGNCSVTITNETEICVGVNSTELQLLLSSGQMEGRLCDFAVEEFACASLSALTAEHLAAMLMCNRSSNSSGSRPIWKLLLSKASRVLDEALDLLTNKTLDPRNPALPVVLDSIREIRLDVLDTVSINHPDFIQLWFNRRLRPLLSAVSPDFLSCLVTKGLNCSTYQHILQVFIHHFDHMDLKQKHMVLKNFILPLLSQPQSGPGCVNGSGNSTEWLKKNLGPFSAFLSLTELLHLNPLFNPMEALRLLTPKQSAELLVSTHPSLPDKDIIINRLFDFLMEAPEQNKIPEFMFFLSMFLQKGNLSCSSYKTLFTRLDMASIEVSPDIASNITYSKIFLSKHLPPGCIIYGGNCSVTITNETEICVGVNSTELQLLLSSGQMEGRLCDFAVEEFACASLSALTAEHLAAMLMCNRSSNSSGSRPIWKLLLSKASRVLDEALDLLANKTLDPRNPALSVVLDSIREIRLDVLDIVSINHPDFIQLWFNRRLRPLLSAVSPDFLSCLVTKGLNCSTYQHILQVFIYHFDHMALKQKHMVLKNFILPLLSQPQSGPGCVNGSGNSTEWLKKNLGPFSAFLSLTELLHLNPLFNPMEALRLLTPKQSAELLVSTHPSLPDKDIIINRLFDFLTEAPEQNKIPEFMFFLGMFLQKGNLSCSSYKTLFTRLDMASIEVSPDIASNITYSKIFLSKHLPPGCIIYGGNCSVTITNETEICVGVNSRGLQLLLSSGQMVGRLCDFAVEKFACASLSALTAEHLAAMLMCNRSSNSSGSRPIWKLLLSKASHVLDEALDLLANKTLDPRNPALSVVLDSIREIRLDVLDTVSINHPDVIQLWFNRRLRPLLSAVSPDFLSCLAIEGLNCTTYQHILQILNQLRPNMTLAKQKSVYVYFIKVFLTRNNTKDPSCSFNTNNSGEWLQKNLGGFSDLLSFSELQMLYANFSGFQALPQLTVLQLAEMSSTPGQLKSAAEVNMVMKYVPSQQLPAFFDMFSPAIMAHVDTIPSPVRSAMLQVVFDRANLSNDSVVMTWLNVRLPPLLVGLSLRHIAPFFKMLTGKNCSVEEQGVMNLNSAISSLSNETKEEIHNHIIQMLRGPQPLQCYGDNYNRSYYGFLQSRFMGFQFPNLTTFLSLMPHNKMPQLVNSMPPSALGDYLRRPDIVDSDAQLCVLFNSYTQTPEFLENESLPKAVRRPTLPCVWPMALSSSKRSEVNAWFDRSLNNYLVFLTKTLISPNITHNATCMAFQKLVSVLGDYNYTAADFMRRDVFTSIRDYLNSATVPRCYNSSNPELNSTAWFADYIGSFTPFLTLDDLLAFGSSQVIQVFTVNLQNIALFNHSVLPLNFTNYYTQLVYQQDSNFNPIHLPLVFRCVAPGEAFSQLTETQSVAVLNNLTNVCTDLDPQISAALASNFGDNIDSTSIAALGNESSGLSTGQLQTISPEALVASLNTLSTVMGWNEGQAKAIIESITSSGMLAINDSSSLLMLGSLVVGVPTRVFTSISGSQLITSSKDSAFLVNLMTAPQIVQQTFVTQIVAVNSNSEVIIENVPDELATEIPRALLLGLSNNGNVVKKVNKKKWKRQQVELFFSVIAAETSTTELGGVNNLSSSVLQGFTCTGVRTIQTVQIKKLIKACRRKGKNKVKLVETQLTCMYNYIKGDSDATSFDLYPPDLLLYYGYSLVPQASCKSYFQELADADFEVFSSDLSYKRAALFANARSCLGITTTSLTKDNIMVLGNMCCTLDGSYIENSDPYILEKLKNCPDLTDAQASAAQALLLSGKTQYGATSTWDQQTLEDLGMLPLYMTSTFYDEFDKKTKRKFLRDFLELLKLNRVDRQKRRRMRKQIRKSNRKKSKRSIVSECTVGTITRVTISDVTFPFDYDDVTQFNCCLSAETVKNNLDAITEKVDDEEYLAIILQKLHEAYAHNTTIPENQVQLLGPASRVATVSDINKWSITQVDTLSALMDSSNGDWDPSLAKAVISNYLSNAGNKLGSAELNTIGGVNLCVLDVDVLKNISIQSLRDANALNVSACTTENKNELFTIARQAFTEVTRTNVISLSNYQLISNYLGGANLAYIQSLVSSNVSMDLVTFTSLDESVIMNLTVSDIRNLLGRNLGDLKSYENQTVVQTWIRNQPQSELDTLSIGLNGGKASTDTTTSNPATTITGSSSVSSSSSSSPTSSSSSSSSITTVSGSTSSTSTSSTTTGHGSRIRADAGFSLFFLLVLLVASQHVVT